MHYLPDPNPAAITAAVAYVKQHHASHWRIPRGKPQRIARAARIDATARFLVARTITDRSA